MDTKAMIELIEVLKQTDYDHIEVEHDGNRLVLSKHKPEPVMTVAQSYVPAAAVPAAQPTLTTTDAGSKVDEDAGIEIVKSPIVGTFYSSSSPETPAFVQVGTRVKKGDVLCIIEAMKLMNEIEAEIDGEIVEVLIHNEDPVEYGQPLFKIKA